MRHIPIIYPISLVIMLILTFAAGVYAVAEGALEDIAPAYAATASAFESETVTGEATQHDWYEQAAVWICPLH